MNDEQLRALLRLKRFEQPPEGYYGDLLARIHDRQRNELLRRSVFQIALDRIQTLFSTHSMSPVQFAGAMACLLLGGIATIQTAFPDPAPARTMAAARPPSQSSAFQTAAARTAGQHSADPHALSNEQFLRQNRARTVPVRRYVIDPRPASYEPSFSF
jgi:hypothetical protein